MNTITKYIAIATGSLCMLTSCSDSWLQTDPTNSASSDQIMGNVDNVKQAINGICKVMVSQHSAYGQGFNGEGTIKMYYGEYPGQDLNYPYMNPGWAPMMNGQMTQNASSKYDSYPWYYYYILVGNANGILANIDKSEGTEKYKQFLKAEALTFRAYSFFRLSEIYCDSWKQSNNGATKGIVLRLDQSTGDKDLSTLADTYTQIYKDLDEAVSLFQSSGLKRTEVYADAKDAVCFPDLSTAYAVYARAALTKDDYTNALKYAKLATEGHPLMSNADYKSGFKDSNDEWIWGVYNNDPTETIYYYAWQVMMACNGYYAKNRMNVCVNRTLAESFPDNDVRKGLFLTEKTFLTGNQKFTDVVLGDAGQSNNGAFSDETAYNKANEYVNSIASGVDVEQNFAYANLKFQTNGQPGLGNIPIFRSSEMLLIEAEANYFLGNSTDAQQNLDALNKDRQPGYTCTKTGEALLKEIKQYRRLELWGEGFSWFDCKRWNDPVVREGFKDGGNYFSAVAGTYGTNPKDNFWKWIIPNKETDYNLGIK